MNGFIYPDRLPSLNEVVRANRTNKFKGAAMKSQLQRDIGWYIKKARVDGHLVPVTGPVVVVARFFEPNKRRDVDNIISGMKFVLDAMVEEGILPNDTQQWVTQIRPYVFQDKEHPRVEIILEGA